MDQQTLLWVLGAMVTFVGALASALWMHISSDRDRDRLMAKIATQVDDIKTEIGSHDAGMIGQLHRYSKIITRLCERAGIEQ